MKKKLSIFLALILVVSLMITSLAFAEAPEGESPEGEAVAAEGESAESEGESEDSEEAPAEEAEAPAEDAESAESEGESEEAPAEEAPAEEAPAEEAAGEDAAAEEEGDSGDSSAEADPEAEAKEAAERERLQSRLDYSIIPADGEQVELGYIEGVTTILEVDGLKFKDMNKNGELDVYEDWRADIEDRIADLISQLTIEEEAGLLFCCQPSSTQLCEKQDRWFVSCWLFNENGTPDIVANTSNNLQAHGEATRLGIPWTFASDREYNAWGGYVDKPHEAYGSAWDPDLAYELSYYYGQAMRAVGIHVTFEPFAEELGAQYGEGTKLIKEVAYAEIKGLEDSGFASCTKHWIARGGDSNFGSARSVAQNFDNWMVGWKAAMEAGCEWVMTNCGGTGISNNVDIKWDSVSMGYLRNELGFDGVVVTDWWAMGGGPGRAGRVDGIDCEGVDLGQQTGAWLMNRALELGLDVFGGGVLEEGTDWETNPSNLWPQVMIDGMYDGTIKKDIADRSAARVLRFKMKKGLFENPYVDPDAAVALTASAKWAEERFEVVTDEDLREARNEKEVELEERLMAESAVLIKNDGDMLPLAKGTKVYIESSTGGLAEAYGKYITEKGYGEVVDDPEAADVMIGDFGQMNDAAELFIEDAIDYEKPIVYVMNSTSADLDTYLLDEAEAILWMRYRQAPDHGSSMQGFTFTTLPWVYADLLFGEAEPGGVVPKEIVRDAIAADQEWKDLAGDMGASPYVRLMIQATMEDDEELHESPTNWGDPLIQAYYGMSYGAQPEFKYSCLILPQTTEVVEEEVESGGSTSVQTTAKTINKAAAGEPFSAYVLLRNNGADGITKVGAYVDGELVNEKYYTVSAGSWRVVEIEITVDAAGDHEIMVGDQVQTITIGE